MTVLSAILFLSVMASSKGNLNETIAILLTLIGFELVCKLGDVW